MRDPYEVLGVGKNADAAAIKSAYRRLAKKLHPDANKSDPKTAQRFAELNSAYASAARGSAARAAVPDRVPISRRSRSAPRASRAAVQPAAAISRTSSA